MAIAISMRALATDARVIGVNARDLESLDVDLVAALGRLARIDDARLTVLESGIRTRRRRPGGHDAGASAMLVGEALMRAGDPGATLRALIQGEESIA